MACMNAQTVSASFKSSADVNGDQYSTDLPLQYIKLDPEIAAEKKAMTEKLDVEVHWRL